MIDHKLKLSYKVLIIFERDKTPFLPEWCICNALYIFSNIIGTIFVIFQKISKFVYSCSLLFQNIPDEEVEVNLKSTDLDAPHLVVFEDEEGRIKKTFLVGHGAHAEMVTTTMTTALLTLIGTYFVLNMQYPKCYSGVLGIFQSYWLNESQYVGWKSTPFKLFESRLVIAKENIKE